MILNKRYDMTSPGYNPTVRMLKSGMLKLGVFYLSFISIRKAKPLKREDPLQSYSCQILTTKVDPRTVRVGIFIMALDQ